MSSDDAGQDQTTRQHSPGKGPLPLVVGVTGHRDLRPEDIPVLEARIDEVFADLRRACPHTPLAVMSPLAEGADRLVAKVALHYGAGMVCPLPLPRAEYERDFGSPESLREFSTLLDSAINVVEMPLLPGTSLHNLGDAQRRADQYALVGAYVVRNCQVLIALWNGLPATVGGGGTGEIVGFMYDGIPARFENVLSEASVLPTGLLDVAETGPVFHIRTPRLSHPTVENGKPLTLDRCYPGDEAFGSESHGDGSGEGETAGEKSEKRGATVFQRILQNLDEFNAQALEVAANPTLSVYCKRNAGYLLPDAEAAELSPRLLQIRQNYAIADTLAQRYQQQTFTILKVLCAMVFAALLIFELTSKLASDVAGVEILFPLVLAAAYVVWHQTVRKGRWQDRYQDYRALAEGMRVEFFWRLAGLPTSVSDHYLRRQRGELDWIRIAVRNLGSECFVPIRLHPALSHRIPHRFDLVMKHWVDNQAKYFKRAVARDERELERFEGAIQKLIAAGPIIALATGLLGVIPSPLAHFLHHTPLFHKILIILVFTSAGVGGILHTYLDRRALPQQVKQYERMASLFGIACGQLETALTADNPTAVHKILLDLGRETLAENGDWVLMHRERPVDVPHAG